MCNRKDEWQKHGVCAACVEGMNSPLRYFQICIKLRHQFDIHRLVHVHVRNTHMNKSVMVCARRLLEDAGITPSCDQAYKVTNSSLWTQVGGTNCFQPIIVSHLRCGVSIRTSCLHAGVRGSPGPGSTSGWQTWDPVCDRRPGEVLLFL